MFEHGGQDSSALAVSQSSDVLTGADRYRREMNGGADPNDGMNLKQRWDDLRPRVIRPLGRSLPSTLEMS